ncbi:GtrA family protein [Corynebacterium uterequi]|nr:GtrA family protein [Corynebacterium uterequi]
MRQFIMFGLVGGSGTIVNLIVVYLTTKLSGWLAGISVHDVFVNLFGTQWNIRWYHVFTLIAFLVANTWNYQLNRVWTFRGISKRSWLRGYFPFLTSGLVSLVVTQIVTTFLMNQTSPIALPAEILDDSTGLRTMFYWASAIAIVVAMPINFGINKLWAFGRPRTTAIVEDVAPH